MIRHARFPLAVCLLWLGTVLSSQAQITYGAKIGTSLAAFSANGSQMPGGKPGFQIGGFADYLLDEKFSLTGTVCYSLLNPTWPLAPTGAGNLMISQTDTYQMNLAELGVSANYKLPLLFLGDLCPTLVVGHTFDYNFYTNQKRRTTLYYPDATYASTSNEQVTSSFNPILYSVQGALRFDLSLDDAPVSIFVLELGYKYTYNNVLTGLSSYNATKSAGDFRMHMVYTTVGIKF